MLYHLISFHFIFLEDTPFNRLIDMSIYLLVPLLRNHAFRRHSLGLFLANLAPIRAEGGAIALLEALHHGAARVWVCALVQFAEEGVCRVAGGVVVQVRFVEDC